MFKGLKVFIEAPSVSPIGPPFFSLRKDGLLPSRRNDKCYLWYLVTQMMLLIDITYK